jgi:Holliday junction resolvase
MNACRKGKRGELEFAHYLISKGYAARRGQQHAGSPDSPDVVTEFDAHFEVKRVEALNVSKAMEQAVADCGSQTPIVAHRRNNEDWLLTIRADDFFQLVRKHTKEL